MSSPPLTPPEEERRRLHQRLDELNREWEELIKQANERYIPGLGVIMPARFGLRPSEPTISSGAVTSAPTTVVPAWLAPLLQGITLLIVIGAVFWAGQTTGTLNTKVDNLQKSVDKLNDWHDKASISLGSVDTKVTLLNAKIDDLSKRQR
jgi:hypothetical protein